MTSSPALTELLVDDEIVALAVRAGKVWPAPTPTVIRQDEEQILAAVQRGIRSLQARGLLERGQDRLSDAIGELVDVVFGGKPAMCVYVASESGGVDRRFSQTLFHAGESFWVSEEFTPFGVHYLERVSKQTALGRMTDLVDSAMTKWDEGSPISPGTNGVSVESIWIVSGLDRRAAVIGEGAVTVGNVDDAKSGKLRDGRSVANGSQAIAFLANAGGDVR